MNHLVHNGKTMSNNWDRDSHDVAPRLSHTISDLLYNEKFETWLNLDPLAKLVQITNDHVGWTDLWSDPSCPSVSMSTKRFLEDLYSDPSSVKTCRVTPLVPATLIQSIIDDPSSYQAPESWMKDFSTSFRIARSVVKIQNEHVMSNTNSSFSSYCLDMMEGWMRRCSTFPVEILASFSWYTAFNNIIMKHKSMVSRTRNKKKGDHYAQYETFHDQTTGVRVKMGLDIAVLDVMNDCYLLSVDYLKLIHNKLSELFNTLVYCHFQSGTTMPVNHYKQVVKFLSHICEKLVHFRSDHGNDLKLENTGFVYVKTIEGLAVSYIIEKSDTHWEVENTILGDALWDTLLEQQLVVTKKFRNSSLYKLFCRSKIVSITELIGTVKICGHPSIEVVEGLISLKEKTTENIKIDPKIRDQCTGMMIRDITKTFFFKHKRYPKMKDTTSLGESLQLALKNNLSLSYKHIRDLFQVESLEAWSKVIFDKNAEFEEVDQLLLLKDKAIGVTRPEVLELFEYTKEPGKRARPQRSPGERRAILNYLLNPDQGRKLERYLQRYEGDHKWTNAVLNYLVIKLTPKELELKPKGRMFGSSPPEERARRIIQEYNTMEFMDKYEPSQLLTPGELQILQKLVAFREMRQIYPDHQIINISFDFSSWNNSMRSESVDIPAGAILDNWFGKNIYKKTMQAFQKSVIYYHDAHNQDKWNGQEGGIEGLNQATWSIVFVGGMKLALEKLGYRYQVTVKGDDVRSAIIVPNEHIETSGYIEVRTKILNSIKEICDGMGWKLNPNESFVSSSLIATSKQYLVNRTWCPSSIKKIKKIESHSNITFLTTEDLISSMYSVAHSACGSTTVVMPAFLLATFAAARLLVGLWSHNPKTFVRKNLEFIDRRARDVDEAAITAFLLWPQVLGGPGALPLQTFFVRGENDMLSVGVSLWRFILCNSTCSLRIKKYIVRLASQRIRKQRDKTILLGDPYSLDIDCPERPGHLLKKYLRESLSDLVVNPNVRALLSTKTESDRVKCEKFLSSMNPLIPKLNAAIWECAPFSLIDELLSKFTESGSIIGLLESSSRKYWLQSKFRRLLRNIVDASKKRWNYWNLTLNYNPSVDTELGENEVEHLGKDFDSFLGIPSEMWYDPKICTTGLVHAIREHCWGVPLIGITYPSLVDQNHFFVINNDDEVMNSNWFQPGMLEGLVSPSYSDTHYQTDWFESDHYSHTSGLARPWLGHKTSTKAYLPDKGDTIRSPTLIKIDKLICIRTACGNISKELQVFIDSLISCYCSISPEVLQVLAPANMENHLAHRVQTNAYSLATMPNCRPNIAQTVVIENNPAPYSVTDNTNRTINYAARHFFFLTMATYDLQFSSRYYVNTLSGKRTVKSKFCDLNSPRDDDWCVFCCDIVDDVPVDMGIPPNLSYWNYTKLNLVRANATDEGSLLYGINQMIGRRKDRNLEAVLHEYTDEEVLSAVLNTLQDQYSLSRGAAQQLAQISQVGTEMSTDNIEMSQKLFGKVIHGNLEVPKTWAKCRSQDLYHGILVLLWQEFLRTVASTPGEDANTVADIPRYLIENLVVMLGPIIKGGGLFKIMEGAAISTMAKLQIVFPYGSETNHRRASEALWRQLYPIYVKWAEEPSGIPEWTSSVYGATREEVKQSVSSRKVGVLHLVLRLISKSNKWPIYVDRKHILTYYLPKFIDYYMGHVEPHLTRAERKACDYLYLHLWSMAHIRLIDDFDLDMIFEDGRDGQDIELDELLWFSESIIQFTEFECSLGTYETIQNCINTDLPENFIGWVKDKSLNKLYTQVSYNNFFDNLLVIKTKIKNMNKVIVTFSHYDEIKSRMHSKSIARSNILEKLVDKDKDLRSRNPLHYPHIPSIIRRQINNAFIDQKNISNWDLTIQEQIHTLKEIFTMNKQDSEKRDNLVSLSRIMGTVNKSIVRYVELFERYRWFNIPKDDNFTAIVVGDGGGSVSRLLLHKWPNVQVIYSTLHIDSDSLLQANDFNVFNTPTNFRGDDIDSDSLMRLHYIDISLGDITNEACLMAIDNKVTLLGNPVLLVVSDADWSELSSAKSEINDHPSFLTNFLALCSEYSKNSILMSVCRWICKDTTNIPRVLHNYLSLLPMFSVYAPTYSRPHLCECFVVSNFERSNVDVNYLTSLDHRNRNMVTSINNIRSTFHYVKSEQLSNQVRRISSSWSDFMYSFLATFPEMLSGFSNAMTAPYHNECLHKYFSRKLNESHSQLSRLKVDKDFWMKHHDFSADNPISETVRRVFVRKIQVEVLKIILSETRINRVRLQGDLVRKLVNSLSMFDIKDQTFPSLVHSIRTLVRKEVDYYIRLSSWMKFVYDLNHNNITLPNNLGVTICQDCYHIMGNQETFIDLSLVRSLHHLRNNDSSDDEGQ